VQQCTRPKRRANDQSRAGEDVAWWGLAPQENGFGQGHGFFDRLLEILFIAGLVSVMIVNRVLFVFVFFVVSRGDEFLDDKRREERHSPIVDIHGESDKYHVESWACV